MDIWAKNIDVSVIISTQRGLRHLPGTWKTPHGECGDMLRLQNGHVDQKNSARAAVDIGVSSK